jgi:hypothetical protein
MFMKDGVMTETGAASIGLTGSKLSSNDKSTLCLKDLSRMSYEEKS